eukprot:TRINITY_DN7728_c0_g1_i1.p1 TRINITY_DN7728_c0_g1~~TRINITY_DN7728_c0_g1_i1.p1  ORF type:complete len:158 (+),score=24.45 TRINITY_DN7728_c0_g1_i1:86-559(+)
MKVVSEEICHEPEVLNWADDYPSEDEVAGVLVEKEEEKVVEGTSWRCACLFYNREQYQNESCYRCGQPRPRTWECPQCAFTNKAKFNNKNCFRCHMRCPNTPDATSTSTSNCTAGLSSSSSSISQTQHHPLHERQRKRGTRAGKKVKERQRMWQKMA